MSDEEQKVALPSSNWYLHSWYLPSFDAVLGAGQGWRDHVDTEHGDLARLII